MGVAPGTGCGSAQPMLEVTDASSDAGSLRQFGQAIIIVCCAVGTHEGSLVLGILMVQIHVSSPALAGMLMHGRGDFLVLQSIIDATRRRSSAAGMGP